MITESDFKLDSTRLTFYYDKFKYKMSIKIKDVHCFRSITSIQEYYEMANTYCLNRINIDDEYIPSDSITLLKPIEKLIRWRVLMINKKLDFKLRFDWDNIKIYSNDFTVFQFALDKLDYTKDSKLITYNYSDQMMNYEKGIIYQKNPKRKFRIYMKSMLYTREQRDELYKFLTCYDYITMCPSMTRWATPDDDESPSTQSITLATQSIMSGVRYPYYLWTWDNYFFDFDQESLITILSLKFDNLIKKVCTIQKR